MLSNTSVTREANTVKVSHAYEKLLKRFNFVSGFAMLLSWLLLPALAAGQVSFVQVNSSDPVSINRISVGVPFTSAQTAGNLNVVVVGWPDTSATIASVTDSNGNPYALAATTESTPVPAPGGSQLGVSQAIYYARNIIAGANTVTVTFNQNTAIQSIRIVEYTGLDKVSPLDTSVGNTGNALTADSTAVTTNSANDLLFGAGTITTGFTGPGTGFTQVLINGLGDIVEDQVVAAAASYNATATLGSGSWVMQMVAFRAAGQTPPTFAAPTISSLSPASGPEAGGTALAITGTNFETGAAVVFSNSGTTAAGVNCSVASATTINCLTPSFPLASANVTVTNVDGQASAPSAFTYTASTPFSTAASPSITPGTGSTNGGTIVIISGSDFAAGATVTVGGLPADRVVVVNVNTIQANMPAGSAGLKTVVVTNPSGTGASMAGGYTFVAGTTGVNFMQVNSAQPASPATIATVNYTLAQTAGNLNVVVVGWADATATVQSVTDNAGNTYTLSFPATVGNGLSQAIYYARSIVAAGSNTVTVTFSAAAQSPDVRILEYSGLDTVSPLDDTSGQSGNGTLLDSGVVLTNFAGDLVVGASMAGGKVVTASPIFTTVTTTPGGISVEHLPGPAATSLDAVAIQDSSANWVMQAVSFKQAGVVPDFTTSVTGPTTATVVAGSPATYTISVSPINGFNSPVTLTCSGLPLGTSCAFAPPAVTPGATAVTSTLTITTNANTPAATSTVTVTGTFGPLSHGTTVSLTVTPAPDFTIAAAALAPATVPAGGSATSTVTIAALNGFIGATDLTCTITPVVSPAPACAFNPTPVPGGSGTSALTVSTSATTPVNVYNVTITGTSGSLSHTNPLSLTVTAAPVADFTIAASALAPATVAAGASSTSTITIAQVNSFTSAVALTCSVAPVATRGPTCAFNPASVPGGSGNSTLTVSTTAATTASLVPRSTGLFYAMLLPIGGLALLGTGLTSHKKKVRGFLLGCLLFSSLIILPACGGSSSGGGGGGGGHPGTPAGTYTVTVTGTSGSLTHSQTVALTVQ
jgi:IPT/TIG domain-containing protein